VKNAVILTLVGALLGVITASYVVPPALSWYTEPGGLPDNTTIQAVVNIPDVIRYSTGRLIRGQFIGGMVGGTLGLVLGIFLAVKARRKPVAAS
jgi:hypothetical protein